MRFLVQAALILALASPASAGPPKSFHVSTKVGRSNVVIDVVLHPQVDGCSAASIEEIRKRAVALGQVHVRENLAKLVKQSGTDASGDKEFFGVRFLAGCPADGGPWIVFPADGPNRVVTRFEAGRGWSALAPI